MKHTPFLVFLLAFYSISFSQSFKDEQLQYSRVREAKEDYNESLKKQFNDKNVNFPPQEIYIRSFKFDKELELWAKGNEGEEFKLIKTYKICKVSGALGPKRERGDFQIPEGVYQLENFNPVSSYHLSMKINYPNAADRILGTKDNLGGEIYIHGDCVTIGCIPIQKEPIKELYWLSVLTKSQGGTIPIHIFPFRMDQGSLEFFHQLSYFDEEDWNFWNQLLPIYNYFEDYKQIPKTEINSKGEYYIVDKGKFAKKLI